MTDRKKTELKILEKATPEAEKTDRSQAEYQNQKVTNPLVKRFLEFSQNRAERFSVKDLFKK